MLYNCHQRSDNSYMMSDVYQQLYYSCYQTSGLRPRIHAFSCFHWKRFDFKVCLWGRKVTSRTFNKRVPEWHKFVYCTRIIWCTAEESVNAFVLKKKTAYFVICPSNQPLCFSPLSQVGGRALLPSLQPNRAPATAPLVSASPPCKMRNTTRLKQTVVAWKFGTQVQVAWESSQPFATSALVSLQNDVWEMSTEIPYWWCVTTKIWVVLLIGPAEREICLNQSVEALTRSG